MIRLEVQYFNLNKMLLLAIGLWPYQQSKFTRFQFMFLSSILTTSIIFQLTSFITLKCTSDLIAKVVSSTSFFTTFTITYNSFSANIKIVKHILMQIQNMYDELKDEKEIEIIKKYGYDAKRYTVALTAVGLCVLCVGLSSTIIGQCRINMFDVDLTVNVTQPRRTQFITEYFIDQEKYFLLILLHINVAFCIGTTVTIATGTLLIGYVQFIFGMFKISSYRIECAVKMNIPQKITLKNEISKSKSLMCAVDIHRQAMRLSEYVIKGFQVMFLSISAVIVISLCTNGFRFGANITILAFYYTSIICQIVSSGEAVVEALIPFLIVFSSFAYLFICNFIGQNIIDHNNQIFITAYSVQWYVAPLHIQKMILFLLIKGAKDFTIKMGGILVSSIETFAMLMKATVSYFTVLLSVM